jgi:multidrug resistance efflux pump
MPAESVQQETPLAAAAEKMRALGAADLDAGTFWSSLIDVMATASGAAAGCVALRESSGGWKLFAPWPASASPTPELAHLGQHIARIAEPAAKESAAVVDLPPDAGRPPRSLGGVRLVTLREDEVCVAAFCFVAMTGAEADDRVRRLLPMSHLPAQFQSRQGLSQAKADVDRFASVLDLLVTLNQPKRFVAVAMSLCNELASRHHCERVSLGWLDHGRYVRLRAISHTEHFEKKMDAVRVVEAAMEECLDQDDELVWPAPAGSTHVMRDHEALAARVGSRFLCSLPIRIDGKGAAVVLLERKTRAFEEGELRLLRLCCDLVARRLADVERQDVWFGARWWRSAREAAATLAGPEHTWAKIWGALCAVLLAVLLFGRMTYRVEAPFLLKPEQLVHVPAPFDGYIDAVDVRPGDVVTRDAVLMRLDTKDLLLDEASAAADHERYAREAEKARAANALADMRIATALADGAKARLDLVRYRLSQSALKAPFEGVVVEGDLRERIGSPVGKGDPLFRLARLDDMYVQCEVGEADIHEIREGAAGEIAFASDPRLKFPMRVARVDPVARAKEGSNVFTVRCAIEGAPQDWWRPGMSGIAKVEAGSRGILWILTHRTADFLRMKLWW